MSTNVPRFKYFDNSLSLFEIVDSHFPYIHHINKIRQPVKENSTRLFISAKQDELKEDYPSFSLSAWKNYQQLGFVAKLHECDWTLKQLIGFYNLWPEFWQKEYEKLIEVFRQAKNTNTLPLGGCDKLGNFLEKMFFATLAKGVNDVRYLEELNKATVNSRTLKEPKTLKRLSVFDTEKRVLFNIWNKGQEHYDEVIAFLKNTNDEVDKPFLKENEWIGKLTYLRGFINVCKKNDFIDTDQLDIIQLEKILKNTFKKPAKKGSDAFKGFFNKEKERVISGKKHVIENPWEKPFAHIPLP